LDSGILVLLSHVAPTIKLREFPGNTSTISAVDVVFSAVRKLSAAENKERLSLNRLLFLPFGFP